MAKSKEQKQLEAIQRKREGIDGWRLWYMDRQYGTQGHEDNVKQRGQEEADLIARNAKRHFEKLCKEAQVDTHGNPLPGSPGYKEPGLLLDPDATIKARSYNKFLG